MMRYPLIVYLSNRSCVYRDSIIQVRGCELKSSRPFLEMLFKKRVKKTQTENDLRVDGSEWKVRSV